MHSLLILAALAQPGPAQPPRPVLIVEDAPVLVIERNKGEPARMKLVGPGQPIPAPRAIGAVSEQHIIPIPREWYATPEEAPDAPQPQRQQAGFCPHCGRDCPCARQTAPAPATVSQRAPVSQFIPRQAMPPQPWPAPVRQDCPNGMCPLIRR